MDGSPYTPKGLGLRLLAWTAPDTLVAAFRRARAARFAALDEEPTRRLIERQHVGTLGMLPDLDRPRGLTEKLNALKLVGATPLQTLCADKIAVRGYVADRVGPDVLIPAIMTTRRLSDISPRRIRAERFVVKPNHDQGSVVICRDRRTFDWVGARVKLARALTFNHWRRHREPVYKDIDPQLLVEEYLEADGPSGLREYKVFCFGGRPELVMAILEHDGLRTKTLFDPAWRRLPARRRGAPAETGVVPRPERLGDMIAMAATLSAPFRFARVDFIETGGRAYFGEITFFPEGGLDVFEPPEFEQALGDKLVLSGDEASLEAA